MASKKSSIRWTDENLEYINEMIDNVNGYVNELVARERRSAGLTRREQLQRELAELREERQRKQRLVDELADREAELEHQLDEYAGNIEQELEDYVEGISWITRVHPDLRRDKEHMSVVLRKTGLRHSLLVELVEAVDIHYSELLTQQVDALEARGIPYEELSSHPLYDEEAGDELTDEEEDQVREFLRDQL